VSTLFLAAANGADTARSPVWLMRQAGRYLPEYRAIKERRGFWEMCRQPEIAAEVTLQPVRRYAVDAAILFSDIMTPVPAMGVKVEFAPGPVVSTPVWTAADVDRLIVPDEDAIAPFVAEACRAVRAASPVPLIGFAGAPLTVASYLVGQSAAAGRAGPAGPADHAGFRAWLRQSPTLAHALLAKVAEVTSRYLRMQVKAGAQAIQLFDTWAGAQDEHGYDTFGRPYAERVLAALADLDAPRGYLAVGAAHLHHLVATLPADVVSVDWRCSLRRCRSALPGKALQGNLDPAVLLAEPDVVAAAAREVLRDGLGGPHIFNLGHGVLPGTPPDNVARLIDAVRGFDRRAAADGRFDQ
jgi:uroporphyrinogen decarboxylase